MIDYLARAYRLPVIDFERPGHSLLVSAGTGLMLSLMDACPRLRWCLDVDTLALQERDRLTPFLRCGQNVTDLIAVAGWFSSTNPKPLASAVDSLRRRPPVYVRFFGAGDDPFAGSRTALTLDQLIEQINAAPPSPHQAARRTASAVLAAA